MGTHEPLVASFPRRGISPWWALASSANLAHLRLYEAALQITK